MNQIPAEARDCVKQKLGGDIFNILESGDAEKMKNVSQGDIQSAIMSCVTKNIPSGGNGMGPSQEQIQEMMKSGAPPNQEQIQEMIQKNMPSGIPQVPQGMMPPSGFPTPTYP